MTERHLTGVRGLYLKDLDPNGVAADVRSNLGQPALAEGDVITRINRVPVTTLADFQRVLNGLKPGAPVVLNVSRYRQDSRTEWSSRSCSLLINKTGVRCRVSGAGDRTAPDSLTPDT